MTEYKLSDLAAKLGLTLQGDDAVVSGLNTLEAAGHNELSFLANPRYLHFLESTRACAVIIDAAHAGRVERALISKAPYLDFGRALALFTRKEGAFRSISDQAYIDPEASLGEGCVVYPHAFVGPRARLGKGCTIFAGVYIGEDVRIGDNCVLYPNCVLLSRVEMGSNCTVHPGAVIGSDGFGFARQPGSGIQPIPQAGFVRLGDGVNIGSNSAIDRGALGPTSIGSETKIDNLVQIGHNVNIGRENIIVAQVGVAGSCKIGDRATLAGQAGIAGHLNIGDDAVVGPQSGVAKDVPAGFSGGGTPFVDGQTFLRTLAGMQKFPELMKRVSKLEKEIEKLKSEK